MLRDWEEVEKGERLAFSRKGFHGLRRWQESPTFEHQTGSLKLGEGEVELWSWGEEHGMGHLCRRRIRRVLDRGYGNPQTLSRLSSFLCLHFQRKAEIKYHLNIIKYDGFSSTCVLFKNEF